MGTVYRARDVLSEQRVALKLLHPESSEESLRRFTREAELLASLRHPAIVSHVAHGFAEEGRPFLAMEWLEGEDLAGRLARQSLSLAETLVLLRRAAEALVVIHSRGVIHRDLKPSNIFLRAGHPEDAVLLDFGLARPERPSLAMTASHTVVGTPSYMAPEQASGHSDLTPRADFFSLGCVLYECLTGHPPFVAPHFAAMLAKILFFEPAPLRSVQPELPEALQGLLDRMLAKDPAHRFADSPHLLASLEALDASAGIQGLPPAPSRPPPPLAGAEQQLISVLLAAPPRFSHDTSTLETFPGRELRGSLHTALAPYGARVEFLADGSLVATLVPGRGTATDHAALAARCALLCKERWPEAAMVLTTGRSTLHQHLPVGEAMDRAGQLLRQLEAFPASAYVLLDEVTAGLLSPLFQLTQPQPGVFLLQGEDLRADASRPLLGKPTPCVGREQELALMEMALTSCVEEPSAQAVLVVAPAGAGKSRLRHEFLRRLEQRGHPALVLMGRGDPMLAGTAYGLLGQALRLHCDIRAGQSLKARRERLAQRVARHLPLDKAQEVTAFLGELCALPFADEDHPRLRAARIDPWLMEAQVTDALVAFLKAECAQHPVLLVLEDLHWGDAPSVKLVGNALEALGDQPLLVLALARPEVRELFPQLWRRRVLEVPLRGLSHKAGAQLVREVLGPRVSDSTLGRILEQAAGNALFLEELIRAAAEGRGEAPPETVLSMLQMRLLRLEPSARQVLLAASLFGRTFWAGGVQALLGPENRPGQLKQHLQHLVELEIIEPQAESRFSSEAEYRFRHALVRDAAYGLVLDSHKPAGHRQAGEWLEQVGETAPLVLAEHFHLGQQPERAIHFYTLAVEQLFERHDMHGTLRYVEVAKALAARGAALTRLRTLEAMAAFWVNDFHKLYEVGSAVLPELETGSSAWCRLMGCLILGGSAIGRHQEVAEFCRRMLSTQPQAEALSFYIEGLAFPVVATSWSGARHEAASFLARMVEVGPAAMARDPMVLGWLGFAHCIFDCLFEARPWQALEWGERGTRAFLEMGAVRNSITPRFLGGMARAMLGDVQGAVDQLRETLALALRLEQYFLADAARFHLALVLTSPCESLQGEEVRTLALELTASVNAVDIGMGHTVLARHAAFAGELAEAEAQARKARDMLAPFLAYRPFAHTTLCTVLRTQGRLAEAREAAELGVQDLEQIGGAGACAVAMHLELAEACLAQGDTQAGEAALRRALQCLRERVADIPEPAARERFLQKVPENARTRELARQRWGEAAAA